MHFVKACWISGRRACCRRSNGCSLSSSSPDLHSLSNSSPD
jgi:hypothetical protein